MDWSSSFIPDGYSTRSPYDYARDLRNFIISPSCATMIACHIPYVLVDDTWNKLPPDWQSAMDDTPLSWHELMHFPECITTTSGIGASSERWPASLRTFITIAQSLHLRMFPSSSSTPPAIPLSSTAASSSSSSSTDDTKSASHKKDHEVTQLSSLVARMAVTPSSSSSSTISPLLSADRIIDVGAGRAYLSHALVLDHAMHVIAIDSNASNIMEAHRRMAAMYQRHHRASSSSSSSLVGTFHGVHARIDPLIPLATIVDRALSHGEIWRTLLAVKRERRVDHTGSSSNNGNGGGAINNVGQTKESKGDKARDQRRLKALAKQNIPSLDGTSSPSLSSPATAASARLHPGDQGVAVVLPLPDVDSEAHRMIAHHRGIWLADAATSSLSSSSSSPTAASSWLLSGLHCCGDLGSAMLRQYVSDDRIRSLVMVSCCYNLLSEHHGGQWAHDHARRYRPSDVPCIITTDTKSSSSLPSPSAVPPPSDVLPPGFPMSSLYNDIRLGYRARKAANRPLTTASARAAEHLIWHRHEYRALVEVVWRKAKSNAAKSVAASSSPSSIGGDSSDILEVGSLPDSFWASHPTFVQYAQRCLTPHLGADHASITIESLTSITDQYTSRGVARVRMMCALQSVVTPLLEAIILMDRWMFLHQQSHIQQVTMMAAFDPLLSPRNMVLIAQKKSP